MYHLTIECLAAFVVCALNPTPDIKRDFPTQVECDRALIDVAHKWKPVHGAWKMNCSRRA